MARTGSLDPLSRYRFTVYFKIDGDTGFIKKAAFESITAPRIDLQIDEYVEGGRHLNPHQLTTGAQFSPVTFRRGKSFSADLYNWFGLVYRAFYGDKNGNTSNYRATIVIDHHDRTGRVIKKYILINARPQAYIAASNFDAKDDTEVSIETLTVTYEGYSEQSLNYSNLTGALGESGAAAVTAIQGGTSQLQLQPGITKEISGKIANMYAPKISR